MEQSVDASSLNTSSALYYYVDPGSGSSTGPVNAYQLAGLLDSAVITTETMLWAEGQQEWRQLQDNADLYAQVYSISAANASALPVAAAHPSAEGLSAQPMGGAKLREPEDEVAKFNADMVALGEAEGQLDAVQDEHVSQRSPSPEEKEFEDDDGTIYSWDTQLRKFQPKSDAPAVNYDLEDMTFQAEEEQQPAFEAPEAAQEVEERNSDAEEVIPSELEEQAPKPTVAAPQSQPPAKGKKRKAEDVLQREADKMQRAKEQEEASKKWFDLKVNTSIYITGLPDDINEQQLAERFSQYGVLKPGDKGAPKVKIYRDKATQMSKGDGLVTFLYEPSVELACKLADEDYFRPGMSRKMKVQPAKFEMHGEAYVPKKKGNRNKNSKEKAKVAEKVLGWGGFDDTLKPAQVTVILENLFHPDDFIEDASLLKDLEFDIRSECQKLGIVEKVRVFAGNPKGIVSVKFKAVEPAEECISKMKGRYFGGRAVDAHMWDGSTNYSVKLQESEEQIAARRARFAAEIEAQENHNEAPEPE